MVALTNAANSKLLTEAREYGRHLAEMLAASHFSTEEKQARMALRGKTHMVPDRLENVIKAAR